MIDMIRHDAQQPRWHNVDARFLEALTSRRVAKTLSGIDAPRRQPVARSAARDACRLVHEKESAIGRPSHDAPGKCWERRRRRLTLMYRAVVVVQVQRQAHIRQLGSATAVRADGTWTVPIWL